MQSTFKSRFLASKISGFFFLSFIALLAYLYNPSSDFDLYRYYDFYNGIDTRQGVFDFVMEIHDVNFDFLYFISFYLVKIFGASERLVTSFYCTFYFLNSFLLVYFYGRYCAPKVKEWVFLYSCSLVVLAVPLLYVFSISRTVAALSLFCTSLLFVLSKQRIYAALLLAFSCLTHIGLVLYFIPVYYICSQRFCFLWGWKNKVAFVLLFIALLTSFYWVEYLSGFLSDTGLFDSGSRYYQYLKPSTLIFDDLPIYDVALLLFSMCFGLLLFLMINQHNGFTMAAGYYLLFFAASIGYSTMLAQRTLMVFSPFLGILFFEALGKTYRPKYSFLINGFYLSSFALFVLNIYGYRVYFSESFFN